MSETKVLARQVTGTWGAENLDAKIASMDAAIDVSGGTAVGTTFTPAGAIAATNVQAALEELDTEKASLTYVDSIAFPASVWGVSGGDVFRSTGKVFTGGDTTPTPWLAFGTEPTVAVSGLQAKTGGFFRKVGETATDAGNNALMAYRQADFTGGDPGYVNSAATVTSVVGAGNTSFEWNLLTRLDNFATAGDNVSAYMVGYKLGAGPTFGAVIDAREIGVTGGGGLIGLELDIYTESVKANAVGIDLITRHATVSGGDSEVGWGLRITADPTSRYTIAAEIAHGKQTCLKVTGHSTRSVKGVAIAGPHQVAFDTSGADLTDAAYRMDRDHFIAFESTSARRLTYGTVNATMGDGFKFTVGAGEANIRWAVNENGATEQLGVLRIAGNQILGGRRPWSGVWSNIQPSWRSDNFDMSTITAPLIDSVSVSTTVLPLWQVLGCLIEDLKAHGIIR